MRSLTAEECEAILEQLGYYPEFDPPDPFLRVSSGKSSGVKAFWFSPLDEGDSIELGLFRLFLLNNASVAEAELDAAFRAVLA